MHLLLHAAFMQHTTVCLQSLRCIDFGMRSAFVAVLKPFKHQTLHRVPSLVCKYCRRNSHCHNGTSLTANKAAIAKPVVPGLAWLQAQQIQLQTHLVLHLTMT